MLFSSPEFFMFFLVYFGLHLFVPKHYRVYLIIIGSSAFYGFWNPAYLFVPILLASIGFLGGLILRDISNQAVKKLVLAASITLACLPLLFYKYLHFFTQEILARIGSIKTFFPNDNIIQLELPIGISFITFTIISYLVDTYQGITKAEKQFKTILSYVLFFPQLIAGPILRPAQLIPQIKNPKSWKLRLGFAKFGVLLFSIGLAKKLLIADPISSYVDPIFADPDKFGFWETLSAVYGFSIQIYCDFGGYTDMALGLGIMLSVRLPINFSSPYLSTNIVDFWRRWHITLSNWIRDYLYVPLGGNRHGQLRAVLAVLVTMFIGGLWHGAAWTFIVWGLLHGVAISITHAFQLIVKQTNIATLPKWLSIFLTFHLVTFLWIFFRAGDFSTALRIIHTLSNPVLLDYGRLQTLPMFTIVAVSFVMLTHHYDKLHYIRWCARYAPLQLIIPIIFLIWVLAIIISAGSSSAFIYFDF